MINVVSGYEFRAGGSVAGRFGALAPMSGCLAPSFTATARFIKKHFLLLPPLTLADLPTLLLPFDAYRRYATRADKMWRRFAVGMSEAIDPGKPEPEPP
jgi:hypothetical protein